MKRVLCICAGNTCRSPMMAAMLQEQLGDGYVVTSAGLDEANAGQPANPYAVTCMEERGMDLSNHRSRPVWTVEEARDVDILVCVERSIVDTLLQFLPEEWGIDMAQIPPIVVPNGKHGGIPDPHGKGIRVYAECVTLLDRVLPETTGLIKDFEPC